MEVVQHAFQDTQAWSAHRWCPRIISIILLPAPRALNNLAPNNSPTRHVDHQNWASPIYISDPGMVMRPKAGAKPALPQKPCFENGPGYQTPTQGPSPLEGGPGPPGQGQTPASTKAPFKFSQVPRVPISFRSGSPRGSKSFHVSRTPDQDCSSKAGSAGSPGASRRSQVRSRRNGGGR